MKYNIFPILKKIKKDDSNYENWKDRLTSFFSNIEYDPIVQDTYYDTLINNLDEVETLINSGYLIDDISGLFTFNSSVCETKHSFNFARYLNNNYQHFYGKKILTVCGDYGILNVQLRLAGLNVVSSIQAPHLIVGSILTCIGNNSPIYPINKFDFEEEDVLIFSCVFNDDNLTYKNWNLMIDKKIDGKEVYFTSNNFCQLKKFMNTDRIQLESDPQKTYRMSDYIDISYGFKNRIYKIV